MPLSPDTEMSELPIVSDSLMKMFEKETKANFLFENLGFLPMMTNQATTSCSGKNNGLGKKLTAIAMGSLYSDIEVSKKAAEASRLAAVLAATRSKVRSGNFGKMPIMISLGGGVPPKETAEQNCVRILESVEGYDADLVCLSDGTRFILLYISGLDPKRIEVSPLTGSDLGSVIFSSTLDSEIENLKFGEDSQIEDFLRRTQEKRRLIWIQKENQRRKALSFGDFRPQDKAL